MRLSQNGLTVIVDITSASGKVIIADDVTDETSMFYDKLLVKYFTAQAAQQPEWKPIPEPETKEG